MPTGYDDWKQTDFDGEREQAEFDARWSAYENWGHDQTDTERSDNMADFLWELKQVTGQTSTGETHTVAYEAWEKFQEWEFENRFPGNRR